MCATGSASAVGFVNSKITMMRSLLIPGLIYLAAAWHMSLSEATRASGMSPQSLVLVLVLGMRWWPPRIAVLLAALLGLISDSLSGTGLGPDVLVYWFWTLILLATAPPGKLRNPIWLVVLTTFLTLVLTASSLVFREQLGWLPREIVAIPWNIRFWPLLVQALWTGGVMVIPAGVEWFFQQKPEHGWEPLRIENRWQRLTG